MTVRDLNLALIGNCTIGALIDARANMVWCCMPRFDSPPVFDALLRTADGGGGCFSIELEGCVRTEQAYVKNTAIVRTSLYDDKGGVLEIVDFAPRFRAHGRMFRPIALVRQLRRLAGAPRIRVLLAPSADYGEGNISITHGSNHVRYVAPHYIARLTTDLSVTAVLEGRPVILEREATLLLGPDETLEGSVDEVGRHLRAETHHYWREWVRYLAIPYEWQEAVIRAAITLKLNAYEDTGAVIAAMTTSIPEAAGSGRNWDYRFCWLRDAYFVVTALGRLGATQTMEQYIGYIINLIADSEGGRLQPVYGINGSARITERSVAALPGYRGMGPVRVGNEACTQVQNDVYGASVLAATQVFFDERLEYPGDAALFKRLEVLGEHSVALYAQPDAGLWELRANRRVHTYSSVMCWAACERLGRIARKLGLATRAEAWRREAEVMRNHILDRAWSPDLSAITATFGGRDFDASLLLLPQLGFLDGNDPRFLGTLAAIERHLKNDELLYRYVTEDDFGHPETAFTVCTFWYVDALAIVGRRDEARALFEKLLTHRNPHGLLSEDIDFATGELWGNFPQTYSLVGLINSALRLSEPWERAL